MINTLLFCSSLVVCLSSPASAWEFFVNSEDSWQTKTAKLIHVASGVTTVVATGKTINDYCKKTTTFPYILEQHRKKYEKDHVLFPAGRAFYFEQVARKDCLNTRYASLSKKVLTKITSLEFFQNLFNAMPHDLKKLPYVLSTTDLVKPTPLTLEALQTDFPISITDQDTSIIYDFAASTNKTLIEINLTSSKDEPIFLESKIGSLYQIEPRSSFLKRWAMVGIGSAPIAFSLFGLGHALSHYPKSSSTDFIAEQATHRKRATIVYSVVSGIGAALSVFALSKKQYNALWMTGSLLVHGLSGVYVHGYGQKSGKQA